MRPGRCAPRPGRVCLLASAPAWAVSDVVVSQVYGGGGNSGATWRNDFIELYNRGATTVDLTGWSVQYASSTGSSWINKTDLSGTLAPGQYYLIQEASNAAVGTILPPPDATGTIAMSASAGKVVLLSSTTAIAGGTICPSGPDVVDIVGYGPATNCAENAATASNLSATTALRVNNGATDTDNNSLDFAVAVPNPRNSTTTSAMVSIVATDPSASEFGANPGSFTVSRIGGNTGLALNVNIAITGSAANGLDFTPTLTSPIAIPANQASTLMTLTPVNDAAPEGTEVVVLTLTAGAGYAVSVATATVTIADDDAVDTAPSVISTTPAEGASSVLLNTALQVNFSEQVDVIGGAITVECPNGSVVASNVTAANNVNSVVLTPVPVWPANTNCSVKVASSGVTDVDNTDPPNNPAANVPATSDR